MAKLKHAERRELRVLFEPNPGYILDFSNATFAEFFEDELSVTIYDDRYGPEGTSKAKRFFRYIELAPARDVGKLLRAVWKHKYNDLIAELRVKSHFEDYLTDELEVIDVKQRQYALEEGSFENLVSKIERRSNGEISDSLAATASKFSFDTVLLEIARTREFIESDPEDAVTASCSLLESMCRSILVELEMPLPKEMSLRQLYRTVRDPLGLDPKKLELDPNIADDVRAILASMTALVDGIASLRTHAGDAHGRERGFQRIDARISKLAVNSGATIAQFLIESWERKYPNRVLPNSDNRS